MNIGIPREIKDQEYRVAVTPWGVKTLVDAGHRVRVESLAGAGSGFSDSEYQSRGAEIVASRERLYGEAEMILKVKEPVCSEYDLLKKGQTLFCFLHLAADRPLADLLLARKVTAIAYETVESDDGLLPILKPMSEIAGRLGVQNGAYFLQRTHGGRGILLSGVPGVERGTVVILGGGTVGTQGARVALGLGARVVILDENIDRLRVLDEMFDGRVETEVSNQESIGHHMTQADLAVGAVLVAGDKAPRLVDRGLVGRMKKGAVVADISVDQGGCFETSRPTTHSEPVYEEEGVIHYCVANIPGAVPRTATCALANVTLPYVKELADRGIKDALKEIPPLLRGLNVMNGKVTHPAVARALQMPDTRPEVASE